MTKISLSTFNDRPKHVVYRPDFKDFGTIQIPNGKVDITDPCYDSSVWCRMNQVEIKPGEYKCFASVSDSHRVATCAIVHVDSLTKGIENIQPWVKIGSIGVDAGCAGFFLDKPDFPDKEWYELCDFMKECREKSAPCYLKEDLGFWTDSGYGDGEYYVYARRVSNQIDAIMIDFD